MQSQVPVQYIPCKKQPNILSHSSLSANQHIKNNIPSTSTTFNSNIPKVFVSATNNNFSSNIKTTIFKSDPPFKKRVIVFSYHYFCLNNFFVENS